ERCAVVLADAARLEAAREGAAQEIHLPAPAGRGLPRAIALRHRVVEKAVRRLLEDADLEAAAVLLQQVAHAADIGQGDMLVGLAEEAEQRAIEPRNVILERL